MMRARTSPCKTCPFRSDCTKGWLGLERMQDIINTTIFGDLPFICHNTTFLPESKQQFCAGKLILEGRINPGASLHTLLGMDLGLIPNYSNLKNQDIIFKTAQAAIEHHAFAGQITEPL